MTAINDILPYIRGNTRNKIVLCAVPITGLQYVDVGYELATLLHKTGGMDNPDTLCRHVLKPVCKDALIGVYTAIENIGILFERELHLNIKSLIEQHSNGRTLIICAEGTVEYGRFLFFEKAAFSVDLEGLSYKSLI